MSAALAVFSFFFNDTATTEIYTLSLHDALPICSFIDDNLSGVIILLGLRHVNKRADRKSTRLNSSHTLISYAVFCLQKKHNRRRTGLARGEGDRACDGRRREATR